MSDFLGHDIYLNWHRSKTYLRLFFKHSFIKWVKNREVEEFQVTSCLFILCAVPLQCGTDLKGGLTSIYRHDRRAGEEVEAGFRGVTPSVRTHSSKSLCTHTRTRSQPHEAHAFRTFKTTATRDLLESVFFTLLESRHTTFFFHFTPSLGSQHVFFLILQKILVILEKAEGAVVSFPFLNGVSCEQGKRAL